MSTSLAVQIEHALFGLLEPKQKCGQGETFHFYGTRDFHDERDAREEVKRIAKETALRLHGVTK